MLNEFDLAAPTIARNNRSLFGYQTRSTTALYGRMFIPFDAKDKKNDKVWKLLVEVVPQITDSRLLNLLGVLTMQIEGDPDNLLSSNVHNKPAIALAWLEEGVNRMAELCDWQLRPFTDAAKAVRDLNYVNCWRWKKRHWNKSRTIACDVIVKHDVEQAQIYSVFKTPDDNDIGCTLLYTTPPDEFHFMRCLGKARWLDNERFELVSKNGLQQKIATIWV